MNGTDFISKAIKVNFKAQIFCLFVVVIVVVLLFLLLLFCCCCCSPPPSSSLKSIHQNFVRKDVLRAFSKLRAVEQLLFVLRRCQLLKIHDVNMKK